MKFVGEAATRAIDRIISIGGLIRTKDAIELDVTNKRYYQFNSISRIDFFQEE